jgi:hypothetical protein
VNPERSRHCEESDPASVTTLDPGRETPERSI